MRQNERETLIDGEAAKPGVSKGANYRVWLEQIVDPSIPEDRLYREVVIVGEAAKLANAVEAALNHVASEQPPPSTAQLWESALGDWSRLRPKRGLNGADLEYRAFAHHLRQLPKALLRAFLIARCPVRAPQLDTNTRELLLFHLDSWQASRNVLVRTWERWDDKQPEPYERRVSARDFGQHLWLVEMNGDPSVAPPDEQPYPPGYRSPRELELDRIMYDQSRSQKERQQAADEIAAIEWKRLEDHGKRWTGPPKDWLVSPHEGGRRKRGAPYVFNPRKPCQKHDVRGCSKCHPRRNRDRQSLSTQYEALAKQEGYEAGVLRAPFGRGKLSATERPRYEALVRVVAKLYEHDYTQETIGTELGRDRKAVSKLIQASRS
jgi:hypothetical protein